MDPLVRGVRLQPDRRCAAAVLALIAAVGAAPLGAQSARQAMQHEPACQGLTLASAGGPLPRDAETLVIRWLGHSNYELVYRGRVFLLDAYYERLPRSHPLGFAPGDITTATAVFIGHPHFDHMADAATVARRTGAAVVGATFAGEVLSKAGVPARQFIPVKGGEVLQYPGLTVEAVLGHHNVIATTVSQGHLEKAETALREAALDQPLSDSQTAQADVIRARGSRDPGIAKAGVINYLFTLANNFRVLFADSPGPITDGQRALMRKIPGVDVAMLPYVLFEAGLPPLVELVKTFRPATLFLGHHDGPGTMRWASHYPPAYAIRAISPETRTLDVLYRTPVCFDTATRDMVIGW